MVKCRPDIAFHATKLSQYLSNPACIHYEALQDNRWLDEKILELESIKLIKNFLEQIIGL